MNDVITLITVTADGAEVTETERKVFAQRKSVKRTEFYAAFAAGQKPQYEFIIQAVEYEASRVIDKNSGKGKWPTKVRYGPEELSIIRVFYTGISASIICG